MRVCLAATICAWGSLAGSVAHGATLTDLASSFEPGKPFGFKLTANYNYQFKTASITRESLPSFQTGVSRDDLLAHTGQPFSRTEVVPDLLYQQQRHTLTLRGDIGVFQDLQLGIEIPLILQDTRQYNLDPNAGYNRCPAGSWSCIATFSSTYLDGIYPIEPADQAGSLVLRPPYRGGGGADIIDTINLSLTGAPISQRRDPTKPTWVIGVEAQLSVGAIMEYDTTRLRQPASSPLVKQLDTMGVPVQRGWNGVSDGLHKIVARTALSHKFKYVDPYFGLWYLFPIPRSTGADSPWRDYGFQNKRSSPQQQAGVVFGFEATPLESKSKGHRLVLDFRGALDFHFLGRGYSEAWELLASSNALICDDETALPPKFYYKDGSGRVGLNNIVTQGTFNPACRVPSGTTEGKSAYPPPGATTNNAVQRADASPYYRQPYTGVTVIENYLSFKGEFGISADLFRHARLRLAFQYQRDQGHVITADDAGTVSYPDPASRATLNGALDPTTGTQRRASCSPNRVDLSCPYDWNPTYRAVINQPGRRYRVDDAQVMGGSATFQFYW